MLDVIQHEQTVFIYKSRTMMCSWLVAGWAAHYGFTHPHTSVVFMGPDEVRACHDVDCVKALWDNALPGLKQGWPLKKELSKQAFNRLEMTNGSWFLGIPGDVDKIRSLHPTIIVFDECAFFANGEAAYNVAAATRAPKFICLSSAEVGWYDQIYKSSTPEDWPEYPAECDSPALV